MTDKVFLNADKTAVVDQFGPGKKWQVSREDAIALGLLPADSKPQARRESPAPAHADKVGPLAPKPQRRRTARKPK